MRGFTLVHLLLAVLGVNFLMVALFVFAVAGAGADSFLVRAFAGRFGLGMGFWGNYLFLSVLVLINALTILIAAALLLWPQIHARLVAAPLTGTPPPVRGFREASTIFAAGVLLLVAGYVLTLWTYARTFPEQQVMADAAGLVLNAEIGFIDIALFTVDQIVQALAFDVLELLGIRFAPVEAAPAAPLFALAAAGFRILIIFAGVSGAAALLASGRGALAPSAEQEPA